ncbi:hypothetical protein [Pseudarthrobacter enclensis]|uniref:Uncharacterized protein n=1 Tax=Pseudarthrobacter enclensis TaxID=993070 RepID=A0ABT9RRJ6_9MICC|nr:hypothetical protein [Pseudarthrobacter enclensis]MDP9887667.1 hypothetical protein [Pseudarthrobacter enclensis]
MSRGDIRSSGSTRRLQPTGRAGVDPWLATISTPTVDRHVATVPYVGQAIPVLRQPIVLNVLMYGAPAVLVVTMLAGIWRKSPVDPEAGESRTPRA